MRQTMKEYQENYFENNANYEIFPNIEKSVKIFSVLSGTNNEESKRRIEKSVNSDWIILNSGKVAVNKCVFRDKGRQ